MKNVYWIKKLTWVHDKKLPPMTKEDWLKGEKFDFPKEKDDA